MSQRKDLVVALNSPICRLVTVLDNICKKKDISEYRVSVLSSNHDRSFRHLASLLSIPLGSNVQSIVKVRRFLSPINI